MSVHYANYDLYDGYIHNWLVAGPVATAVPDADCYQGDDFKLEILRRYHTERPGIGPGPVQGAAFNTQGAQLTWRYVRCLDDHLLDLSAFYHACCHLRAWAYARVTSPSVQQATLTLSTDGPADLWLNKWRAGRQENSGSVSFPVKLEKGHNEILVRLEQAALRQCPLALALRVVGAFEPTPVLIPTSHKDIARRHTLEQIFQAAYLEQDVYSLNDEINVYWPQDVEAPAQVSVRLQTPTGRTYAEAHQVGAPGDRVGLQRPGQIPPGPYQVMLMPPPDEYYEANLRVQRKIDLWSLRNTWSQAPYGDYQTRRAEALQDAASRQQGLFSEIAKMALGQWSSLKSQAIEKAIEGVNQRQDGSSLDLLGLLGLLRRYGEHEFFPGAIQEPLQHCVLNFGYQMDNSLESRQIVSHACAILAGQLYPDQTFGDARQTGQWHRERGQQQASAWLRQRCTSGFQEWDSDLETILMALAYLVDLADEQEVWELAAVLMDKLLFGLALNSCRGVFGSTHGRAHTAHLKSGRLEPTAGISCLLWGQGVFNHHLRAMVSLACAQEYEMPDIIRDIAAEQPEELWSRERHAQVNTATYKTPDYKLCSVQDYRPGEKGCQEHVWQASLGPDAVVFVTHPPCMSQNEARQPNFWRGNALLPRAAQWRDVLVALYELPEDDWLGFTHAYFPLRAFDEHALRDGWAFARKGDGYLALSAAQGMELITHGDSAYRELRSHGQHNAWLCHMGRAALDGGFGAFQDKVLALKTDFEGPTVQFDTLRGESLAFGWQGPLWVNGAEQALTGFKHYDSAYCQADWPASQMDIRLGEQVLRLEFDQT